MLIKKKSAMVIYICPRNSCC